MPTYIYLTKKKKKAFMPIFIWINKKMVIKKCRLDVHM